MADTTLLAADTRPTDPPPAGTGPAAPRRTWGVRWLPGLVVLVAAVGLLLYYGVAATDILRFAVYLLLAVVVPGVLLWRATGLRSGVLIEEVAVGTAIGYCVQVASYIGAGAIGVPNLSLVPPAVILIVFLAVPGLRPLWRGTDQRAPIGWAWFMAGFMLVALTWIAFSYLRFDNPSYDMPFHLALAGELKNHVPPHIPFVTNQPLDYHWYVYAHFAADSWATGIELQTLVFRLAMVPVIAMQFFALAAATRRLTGKWWPGAAVAPIAMFYAAPNPFGWVTPVPTTGVNLYSYFGSPTQTFGAAIFAGFAVLLVDLVRRRPPGATDRRWFVWAIATLMIFIMAGAKATFLPILLCGLALGFVWDLVINRRANWPVLIALGITGASAAFAQKVLYGGGSNGLDLNPFWLVKTISLMVTKSHLLTTGHHTLALAAGVILVVGLWSLGLAGMVGLGAGRAWRDPAVATFLGIGIAALAATLLFHQSHESEFYFWWSGTPYLIIVAIVGLAALLPGRLSWRAVAALVAAAVAGIGFKHVIALADRSRPRHTKGHGLAHVLLGLAWPIAALIVAAVLIGVVVYAAQRRRSGRRGVGLAVVAACTAILAAGVLPNAWHLANSGYLTLQANGWVTRHASAAPDAETAPGGVDAARWLRDHSGPNDVIATNVHCLGPVVPRCDARNFWISAYSERHVLVEGWAYTVGATLSSGDPVWGPYWDPQLLATNDAAFQSPSAATVGALRDRYGVRWLFVDDRYDAPAADLSKFATLRYSSGDCQVYEVPPATG